MMTQKKSIVFVVGAGASKEVNLPIGQELKQKIAKALDFRANRDSFQRPSGDGYIRDALRNVSDQPGIFQGRLDQLFDAGRLIRDAMPQAPSIDNFIHAHRGNLDIALCGKIAIASCILEAEASSKIRVDDSNIYNKMKFSEITDTWYNAFFQLFIAQLSIDEIPERLAEITIITFNYDRCIEHTLHNLLRNYYDVDGVKATELMSHLEIFHPYGFLGDLPWKGQGKSTQFGVKPNGRQLIDIASNLKTFTEGTDANHSDILAIRAALHSAEKVAYLGFSFNSQNLELLYGSESPKPGQRRVDIFGTAYGMSASNVEVIAKELSKFGNSFSEFIHLERDHTCAQLLDDYSRSLMI